MKLPPDVESRDTLLLLPELQEKLEELIERLRTDPNKVEVWVSTTVRGPLAQARAWCRPRSLVELADARKMMAGAPRLAAMLRDEWAGLGPRGAAHLPGQDWHQHGEAVDLCPVVRGRLVWEGSLMASVVEACQRVGLYHAYKNSGWTPGGRHHHAQLSPKQTPLMVRGYCDSWGDVEGLMADRYEV